MKLENILLVTKIIVLLTIGPIAIIGNLGINITGGFWNCPFPLPFIMCNMCPIFCTFGQIRSWLFYGILGTNFLMGRGFCGFFCPGGIIQDLIFKVPLKKIAIPQSTDLMLRYVKYGVAILVIGLVVHTTNLWGGLPQMTKLWSFLVTYRDEVRIALISTAAVVLILALFIGRSCCRYLCPLGAWIAAFNRFSLVGLRRDSKKCVACGLCDQKCSRPLTDGNNEDVWDSLECVRCLQCYTECQGKAFEFKNRLRRHSRLPTTNT